MEDAVWLLEYVGKTKGANHLKLASRYVQYIDMASALANIE